MPFDSRLRAVLFDFDGPLADSYPAITASVNHVRKPSAEFLTLTR